jgi:hypothetical protein
MKKFKENNKYGLMDDNNNIIIHPKYDYLSNFYNGFATYKLENKWGFIDTNGNEIVPPKYDDLWDFENGFAIYKLNEKWGFVDENGNKLTKPLFDFYGVYYVSNHSNNIFWGKYNMIFKNYYYICIKFNI